MSVRYGTQCLSAASKGEQPLPAWQINIDIQVVDGPSASIYGWLTDSLHSRVKQTRRRERTKSSLNGLKTLGFVHIDLPHRFTLGTARHAGTFDKCRYTKRSSRRYDNNKANYDDVASKFDASLQVDFIFATRDALWQRVASRGPSGVLVVLAFVHKSGTVEQGRPQCRDMSVCGDSQVHPHVTSTCHAHRHEGSDGSTTLPPAKRASSQLSRPATPNSGDAHTGLGADKPWHHRSKRS